MDIYDGRRAVIGDLVECIRDDWDIEISIAGPIRIGDRFLVEGIFESGQMVTAINGKSFILGDKHILISTPFKYLGEALFFRIIPPDQKSLETPIKFTIKENA